MRLLLAALRRFYAVLILPFAPACLLHQLTGRDCCSVCGPKREPVVPLRSAQFDETRHFYAVAFYIEDNRTQGDLG
jgi:hypothetical protein